MRYGFTTKLQYPDLPLIIIKLPMNSIQISDY